MVEIVDVSSIKKVFHFLKHRYQTEIRLVGKGRAKSVFVTNEKDFIATCLKYNGRCNIYAGINERCTNGTRDNDVVMLRTLVVDIDAIRTDGNEKEAATLLELMAVEEVADNIIAWFDDMGWKKPVKCMSGNGYQLWLSIAPQPLYDMNSKQVGVQLSTFYKRLQKMFNKPYAKIDNISNLSRVIKVIGTRSVKGHGKWPRPHRTSKIMGNLVRDNDSNIFDYIMHIKLPTIDVLPHVEAPITSIIRPVKRYGNHLKVLNRNIKYRNMYDGDWQQYGFPSRSEAEFSLYIWLLRAGFQPPDCDRILWECNIGKWPTDTRHYREMTRKRAMERLV